MSPRSLTKQPGAPECPSEPRRDAARTLLMRLVSNRWPTSCRPTYDSARARLAVRPADARSLDARRLAMYVNAGVSLPCAAMTAPRSSAGRSVCSANGLEPSDVASAGMNGVRCSPKCMLASLRGRCKAKQVAAST